MPEFWQEEKRVGLHSAVFRELVLWPKGLGPTLWPKAAGTAKVRLGALAVSARQGRGAVVLNISSDAALNPYPLWGAYGASKAALNHMTRIWDEELSPEGIRFLWIDPGDMDTPLHALAIPDADRSTLKRPETAARQAIETIVSALPQCGRSRGHMVDEATR